MLYHALCWLHCITQHSPCCIHICVASAHLFCDPLPLKQQAPLHAQQAPLHRQPPYTQCALTIPVHPVVRHGRSRTRYDLNVATAARVKQSMKNLNKATHVATARVLERLSALSAVIEPGKHTARVSLCLQQCLLWHCRVHASAVCLLYNIVPVLMFHIATPHVVLSMAFSSGKAPWG